jgi:hypothetical protein
MPHAVPSTSKRSESDAGPLNADPSGGSAGPDTATGPQGKPRERDGRQTIAEPDLRTISIANSSDCS